MATYQQIVSIVQNYNLFDFNDVDKVSAYSRSMSIESICPPISSDILPAPSNPKYNDLCRLHWLALSRRAVSVLEFGSGYSTAVLADACRVLHKEFNSWAGSSLRFQRPFHLHSVEESDEFLGRTETMLSKEARPCVSLYKSNVIVTEMFHRIVTLYDKIPNYAFDLIYLDGPSQTANLSDIRGFSFNSPDRMPMAADIITLEFFLPPGCLIIVDGRTANARFLRSFLKRQWAYQHDPAADVHYFELQETPLGVYSELHLSFCLPNGFLLNGSSGSDDLSRSR